MSTLKVNGLTYRTVEREVEKLFEKYGKINEVFIPKDRFSRRSRGFAFVRFVDQLDAESAKSDVDRRIFDGRELRIEWSKKDASGGRQRRASRSRSRSRERRRRRSITGCPVKVSTNSYLSHTAAYLPRRLSPSGGFD